MQLTCRCSPLTDAKMEAPPGTLSMAARNSLSCVAMKKCSGLLSPAPLVPQTCSMAAFLTACRCLDRLETRVM